MKITLTVILFTLTITLLAQGNLQFNKAVSIELTSSISSGTSNTITLSLPTPVVLTVPVGKTLKITNATIDYHVDGINGYNYYVSSNSNQRCIWGKLLLDNTSIASFRSEAINTGNSNDIIINYNSLIYKEINSPIWLTAGTYTIRIDKYTTNLNGTQILTGRLSGIEFNILP